MFGDNVIIFEINVIVIIYVNLNIINYFRKVPGRDWGSNPRPTATPPSTKYQRFSPLTQIAILKKNGALDSGIQA
jgi:hypothetical protein